MSDLVTDVTKVCGELEVDVLQYRKEIIEIINECNSEQSRELAVKTIVDWVMDRFKVEIGEFVDKLVIILRNSIGIIGKIPFIKGFIDKKLKKLVIEKVKELIYELIEKLIK